MIEYIKGDLFNFVKENQIITHVCNDKGGWGSGFVLPLTKKYPKTKEYYKEWYNQGYGLEGKFEQGNCQIFCVDESREIWVANMIAQTLGGKRPLNYGALVKCMYDVGEFAEDCFFDILAPKFGSGLAGGNWWFIEYLIEDLWSELNVTIVEFEG